MRDSACLHGCLVDGETAASFRSTKSRIKSLLASTLLQSLLVAAVAFVPLFARSELPRLNKERYGPILVPRGVPDGRRPPAKPTAPSKPSKGVGVKDLSWKVPPIKIRQGGDANLRSLGSDPDAEAGLPDLPPGDRHGSLPPGLGFLPAGQPSPLTPPPAETAKNQIRISKTEPGRPIHRVEPRYPILALQIRLEGTVVLRAIIGTDGRVRLPELISGPEVLGRAAIEAVQQWRYQPTLLNGQPVEVETQITVVFRLQP